VADHGFTLEAATMARVRAYLIVSSWEASIIRLLQSQEKRLAWKQTFLAAPGIETKMLMLTDPRVEAILGSAFTVEQRAAVTERYASARHLRELVSKLPVQRPGVKEPRFLDGRQMFLVAISFLVCMVGIANAMLMAITERFREIATMKCLGATDGFILKQFLIEAAIQGFLGGVLGALIGLIISIGKTSAILGGSTFTYFPAVPILFCFLFTLMIGVALAMLASVYPSKAAARMAPMDAMRIE
jgi:predicted lysophospholipase L1 biosynthesis ABC-type transport system permease subunit